MNTSSFTKVTVQKWGNSLALRVPAGMARSAHIAEGQEVILELVDSNLVVKPAERKLSLEEKLALFDPETHGGEVMVGAPVGAERL